MDALALLNGTQQPASGDSAAALNLRAAGEWYRSQRAGEEAPPGAVAAALLAALERKPADASLHGTACAIIVKALEAAPRPLGTAARAPGGAAFEFWAFRSGAGLALLAASLRAFPHDAAVQEHAASALSLLIKRLLWLESRHHACISNVFQKTGVVRDILVRTLLGARTCTRTSRHGSSTTIHDAVAPAAGDAAAPPAPPAPPAAVIRSHAHLLNTLLAYGSSRFLTIEDRTVPPERGEDCEDSSRLVHILDALSEPGNSAALIRTLRSIIAEDPGTDERARRLCSCSQRWQHSSTR